MKFKKYQKVRRSGDDRTKGILNGIVTVFPKIDGTNASVWLDNGIVKAGSRNRELTLKKDNQGFYKMVKDNQNLKDFFKKYPDYRLYGEWLVPHTLKTYREDAWREFYVFDVLDSMGEYIQYNHYKELMEEFNINYIPPIAHLEGAEPDSLFRLREKNKFLIKDGEGKGEGIVIKNYDYENKFGDIIWAKIITSEFGEKHKKTMGSPSIKVSKVTEKQIVEDFVTEAFVEKEFSKIVNKKDGWRNEYIPELLSRVFYELINEEMWNIIKEYNRPEIDFSLLNRMTTNKIKKVKKGVF